MTHSILDSFAVSPDELLRPFVDLPIDAVAHLVTLIRPWPFVWRNMQAQASFVELLHNPPALQPEAALPASPAPAEIAPPSAPIRGPNAPTFASTLLGDGLIDDKLTLVDGLRRFGIAMVLAAGYGLAVGTRDGGLSLLKHAAAVPLAPLAVAAVGVPALLIVLTLFDAPVSPTAAFSAASRGAAATGLVLGGLAPAMALFVTTTSSRPGAAISAGLGLILAGIFGLRAFLRTLGTPLRSADAVPKTVSGFALAGFALFATALSARIWWSTLPIFGGDL